MSDGLEELKKGYKVLWWDCGCEIVCPCGADLVLSDEDDPKRYDCGRLWTLETRLYCERYKLVRGVGDEG